MPFAPSSFLSLVPTTLRGHGLRSFFFQGVDGFSFISVSDTCHSFQGELGISQSASHRAVLSAYRQRALQTHPDKDRAEQRKAS